jgi:hypothetical protein
MALGLRASTTALDHAEVLAAFDKAIAEAEKA